MHTVLSPADAGALVTRLRPWAAAWKRDHLAILVSARPTTVLRPVLCVALPRGAPPRTCFCRAGWLPPRRARPAARQRLYRRGRSRVARLRRAGRARRCALPQRPPRRTWATTWRRTPSSTRTANGACALAATRNGHGYSRHLHRCPLTTRRPAAPRSEAEALMRGNAALRDALGEPLRFGPWCVRCSCVDASLGARYRRCCALLHRNSRFLPQVGRERDARARRGRRHSAVRAARADCERRPSRRGASRPFAARSVRGSRARRHLQVVRSRASEAHWAAASCAAHALASPQDWRPLLAEVTMPGRGAHGRLDLLHPAAPPKS